MLNARVGSRRMLTTVPSIVLAVPLSGTLPIRVLVLASSKAAGFKVEALTGSSNVSNSKSRLKSKLKKSKMGGVWSGMT